MTGKKICSTSSGTVQRRLIAVPVLAASLLLFTGAPFTAAEKNAIYYNNRGWEHLKRDETFKAILSFKNALKRNPRYLDAIIGLASAYLSTEAYGESLKLFNRALKLDSKNGDALAGRGFALSGLGRYKSALKSFDEALEVSAANLDAKYGMAEIYYRMGKRIWAKRKLNGILRINPYHYRSLLMMADIKSSENRLDDAKALIEKAIAANEELPLGYISYGKILLREYQRNNSDDYLNESIEEFKKALSIRPDDYLANRYMGFISLFQGQYSDAISYFNASRAVNPKSVVSLYGIALANERMGKLEEAERFLSQALAWYPSDAVLQAKLEDHLVLNSYKIGHPSRIALYKQHLSRARDRMKKKLSLQAISHLRRAIMLNPAKREARELLGDYYLSQDYYRFYINELKHLLMMYPDEYQDELNLAIIRRRKRLSHHAGYATELPPRDVPRVLVLDFWSGGVVSTHYDAGTVIANYLTFTLAQFGRLMPVGVSRRLEMLKDLPGGEDLIEQALERVSELVKEDERVDFIVYGDFREGTNFVTVDVRILNFHNGVVIGEFTLTETGKDNLPLLALRSARRIYERIPYQGRVLKLEEQKIIANLGSFDGIQKDELFTVYKVSELRERKIKVLFKVDEMDTLISSMKPVRKGDITLIDEGDTIYPLKKRRARLLE